MGNIITNMLFNLKYWNVHMYTLELLEVEQVYVPTISI